jgi:formate hydrogenlyase subunit 3/multisubunit Na+/H+ antiporter MnhD subunit
MMAFSSISHAGYLLFAIVALGAGSANSIFVYATAYSIASIIAFGGLILVRQQTGSDNFEGFNGLAKKNPFLALVLTVSMLSLAGIPLTAGLLVNSSCSVVHWHIIILAGNYRGGKCYHQHILLFQGYYCYVFPQCRACRG